MKHIPLTKNHYAVIDDEDYDNLIKHKWRFSSGYAITDKLGYLHRYLLNAPKGVEVDHINRNPLDCRKLNLRIVDRSMNTFNHPKRRTNTSGHVGIWKTPSGNWCAEIWKNYKKISLGTYKNLDEAMEKRKIAELELFGEMRTI